MAQSDSLPDEVAAEIAGLDKRLRDLERTPQLTRSSIDDGRLPSKDSAGRIRSILGKQPDGSHGSRVVESPAQPTPDAPDVSVGKTGVVAVRWGGGAGAPVPLVHGHLEVQAMGPSDADWQVVGTIRDRDGGATTFAADESGTTQVRLVMVGQDRVTRSEASAVSTIEVELPVDEAQLEDRVQQTEDAINDGLDARDTQLRSEIETAAGNTIQRSTMAPTAADGEGIVPGQRWERWTSLDVGGRITGTWVWDGSAWIESGLDETYLPQVAIGQGTYGEMDGGRLSAKTVSAEELFVGHTGNLLKDDTFTNDAQGWATYSGGEVRVVPGGGQGGTNALELAAGDSLRGTFLGYWGADSGWRAPVTGGASYRLRVRLKSQTDIPADSVGLYLRTYSDDGYNWDNEQSEFSHDLIPAGVWGTDACLFTVPAGVSFASIGVMASGDAADDILICRPQLVEAADSSLVVDGAVKAVHLEASESMSTRLVESVNAKIVNLDTNALVANTGFVADLEAHGITLSSEVTDRRFEVSGEGWALTDTSTGDTLASVGVDGDFTATNASLTGTFRTSYPNGAGVTISRGDITYWSQDADQFDTIIETPYVRFTPIDGEKDRDPVIATRGQRLFMTGGKNLAGEWMPVEIDGKLWAGDIRSPNPLSAPGVVFEQSGSYGSISPKAGMVLSSESSRPTGIFRNDVHRTSVVGRQPYAMNWETTHLHSDVYGDYTIETPGEVRWHSYSVTPPPEGTLIHQATLTVDSGNWGLANQRTGVLVLGGESASGVDAVVRSLTDENDDGLRYSINLQRTWR